jgi:hypothetical protein
MQPVEDQPENEKINDTSISSDWLVRLRQHLQAICISIVSATAKPTDHVLGSKML